MKRRQRQQVLRRLNQVYAHGMDSTEKRLLQGMKANFRRMIKERW
jgi:hypothetical protein